MPLRSWSVIGAELLTAVLLVLAAAGSWRHGVHHAWFEPVGKLPGFTSTTYSGGWLFFAVVLIVCAMVAVGDAVRRFRSRAQPPEQYPRGVSWRDERTGAGSSR